MVGRDLEVVLLARDDVHLDQEAGHAEVVDDVGAAQLEPGGLVDRQVDRRHLVAGARLPDVAALGRVDRVGVVERPLPLLADHDEGVVGLVVVEDDVLHLDRVGEEDHDHDDREDRVEDLERQVVAGLDRHLVVAATAVADHHPEDQAPHDDTGDEGGDPGALPQVEGVLTLLGDRLRHGQPAGLGLVGAARQDQHPDQPDGDRGPPGWQVATHVTTQGGEPSSRACPSRSFECKPYSGIGLGSAQGYVDRLTV